MKPIFNFIRIGYGLPYENSWEREGNDSFNRLHIPLSGRALVRVDKKREQVLEPGKMYILPSSVDIFLGNKEGEKYEHLFIDFYISPSIANRDLVVIDLSKDGTLLKLKETFQYLLLEQTGGEYAQLDSTSTTRYFEYFMRAMLMCVIERYNVKLLENTRLAKAMDYIYNHYAEDITNEDIAASINVHPRHLTRLFKQEFNKTPHQCLVEYRVNMAINMLEEGLKINDVYYRCGFRDLVTFRLAFKRMNYMLPSKYKQIGK